MASRDTDIIGLSTADARQVIRMIEVGSREVPEHGRIRGGGRSRVIHCKTPVGGIPARATLTMGSASCDKYDCSSAGVLSDSGDNVTVYNMATSAVAGSTHIIAAYNTAGLLVCIVEDCG